MTADQARTFVSKVVNSRIPEIKNFLDALHSKISITPRSGGWVGHVRPPVMTPVPVSVRPSTGGSGPIVNPSRGGTSGGGGRGGGGGWGPGRGADWLVK